MDIVNRKTNGAELSNAEVWVDNTRCGSVPADATKAETYEIVCSTATRTISGTGVKIVKAETAQTLTMAEVRVYGYPAAGGSTTQPAGSGTGNTGTWVRYTPEISPKKVALDTQGNPWFTDSSLQVFRVVAGAVEQVSLSPPKSATPQYVDAKNIFIKDNNDVWIEGLDGEVRKIIDCQAETYSIALKPSASFSNPHCSSDNCILISNLINTTGKSDCPDAPECWHPIDLGELLEVNHEHQLCEYSFIFTVQAT